jgi:hypothetical protein
MSFVIKEEPQEFDNRHFDNDENVKQSFIDQRITAEEFYLRNIEQNVILLGEERYDDIQDMMSSIDQMDVSALLLADKITHLKSNAFMFGEVMDKINVYRQVDEPKNDNKPMISSTNLKSKLNRNKSTQNLMTNKNNNNNKIDSRQEQIAQEKKRILAILNEHAKQEKSFIEKINNSEPLSRKDEEILLKGINNFLINEEKEQQEELKIDDESLCTLRRLRAKLGLRKMKRKKHVKLFDLDSFVNELIDRENHSKKLKIKKDNNQSDQIESSENSNSSDTDVIFEDTALKTSFNSTNNNNDVEIIELVRVLDRFKDKKLKYGSPCYYSEERNSSMNLSSPIGIVHSRNDDIKCIISPFSNK